MNTTARTLVQAAAAIALCAALGGCATRYDQQGNPIPGLDAFLEQASRHSASCGAQLAPRQRAIQVFDGGPIRGSIGVVQHRTEHTVVHHAFSQVRYVHYSRSPVEVIETRRELDARELGDHRREGLHRLARHHDVGEAPSLAAL